jgi:hypothetical protein
VGPGQRTPESVIRYRLGVRAARRRALAAAVVGATVALAPLLLALELLPRLPQLPRLAWPTNGTLWAVAAGLGALVMVRTTLQYKTTKRRLAALEVTLDDESIATRTSTESLTIARGQVARIVEIDGELGGVRVESKPDPRSGVVLVANVPRGGDGFGDVRARLEQWRAIERRPRAGVGVRVLLGACVVAAIFFLPFFLADFVARSNVVAAVLVVVAWAVTRWTMRGR